MLKYGIHVYIFSYFPVLLALTQNNSLEILSTSFNTHYKYRLLMTFLETCDLNKDRIMIFDEDGYGSTFAVLSKIQPQSSVSFFTSKEEWNSIHRVRSDEFKVDIVIIFIDTFHTKDDIQDFFVGWVYNRDCMVYLFSDPFDISDEYLSDEEVSVTESALLYSMMHYFTKAYFICLMNDTYIYVSTHDPYGDLKPLHWHRVTQNLQWGKKWTFYERFYDKDSDMSQFCHGFDFKRTDPSNQRLIWFTLHEDQFNNKTTIHKVKVSKRLRPKIETSLNIYHKENIRYLKKLLNLEFRYILSKSFDDSTKRLAWDPIESLLEGQLSLIMLSEGNFWNFFYPIAYDNIVIISHDHGSMTPVEKIANFYGKWTLCSLLIILTIAFIMMWLTTKKLSLAAFNVVRLLINAEIVTPMDKWALKLFFSMIFLYFLVIHATFSGHLAEFLTKVEQRPNIDSIEQLKDPRIMKIYYAGFRYDESKEFDVLRQKSEKMRRTTDCHKIIHEPRNACIGPMTAFKHLLRRSRNPKLTNGSIVSLYISKDTLKHSLLGYSHRAGFPAREKFNWACSVLLDTGFVTYWSKVRDTYASRSSAKYELLKNVDFRAIIVSDIIVAFILLIIGNSIGLICFIMEIIYKDYYLSVTL